MKKIDAPKYFFVLKSTFSLTFLIIFSTNIKMAVVTQKVMIESEFI